MEALQIQRQPASADLYLMNSISAKFRATIGTKIRCFCASSSLSSPDLKTTTQEATRGPGCRKSVLLGRGNGRVVRAKGSDTQLKNNWLDSLTCLFPEEKFLPNGNAQTLHVSPTNSDSQWVIGIDPDVSGALALLKTDASGSSAQVFDSPHVKVLVGKRIRRRLDAKSIVKLLKSFDAPVGTTAYIEQSIPFPQDGKQGWWGGGFGYGLWIGILVASGFSVIPVPSASWKNEFKLSGSSKDDSRELASTLFPSLSSWLRRKKDHGRAEALLIAAYGKGLKISTDSSCISEDLTS